MTEELDQYQNRERAATVTGSLDDPKDDLFPFKLADVGRTSSDSRLAKQPATSMDPSDDMEAWNPRATDDASKEGTMQSSLDEGERAIAAANALKEKQAAAANGVGDSQTSRQSQSATAANATGVQRDETDSNTPSGNTFVTPSSAKSLSSAGGGGEGNGTKVDPWLQKPVQEEDAVTGSHRDSRTRFFNFPLGRDGATATRVSRWMPFDSMSDARAASKRVSAEWWQMPELQGAAAGSSPAATSTGDPVKLAPTNPFATDVEKTTMASTATSQLPADNVQAAASSDQTASEVTAKSPSPPGAETIDSIVSATTLRKDKEPLLFPVEDGKQSEIKPAELVRFEPPAEDEAPAADAAAAAAAEPVPLDQKATATSWQLMLKSPLLTRYTNRDKHSNAVEYHPYIVLLKDDKLCIHLVPEFFREAGAKSKTLEEQVGKRTPLMEMKLESSMRFGPVERKRVQRDSRARLHITKLQSWQQREFHGIRALLGASSRTEVRTILKVGCGSLTTLESVMEAVDKTIRSMPVDVTQEVTFRRDEVFCDLVDECEVTLAFDGTLLSRRSTIHVMVQGYLSGNTECQMALNDRKLAAERRNNPSGMFLPPTKDFVEMNNVEFHSATNRAVFEETRLVRFACIQGLRFEALRFQVTGSLPPPLEVRGLLCKAVDNIVTLRANLRWHAQTGRVRFSVHDIEFHIPVPNSWSAVLETKNALGMRRSIKARTSLRGSFRRKRQTASAALDVSVGSAKYEPESGALVWRIDDFPTDREANGTLSCHLELSPSMEKADFVDKQCMMKYGVAGSCVSGASVWSLQIPTVQMKPPKKWVKYDTKFRYLIDMLPSSKYEIAGEDD